MYGAGVTTPLPDLTRIKDGSAARAHKILLKRRHGWGSGVLISNDFEYHLRRADEHWRLARAAVSPEKRAMHSRIADAYVRIAEKFRDRQRIGGIPPEGRLVRLQ